MNIKLNIIFLDNNKMTLSIVIKLFSLSQSKIKKNYIATKLLFLNNFFFLTWYQSLMIKGAYNQQ